MKAKVIECVNLMNALQAIKNVELPATTSYKVSRNVESLLPVIRSYEEQRSKIIKAICPPTEDNPNPQPTPEQIFKINVDLKPVLEAEEEITLKSIDISEMEGEKIAPAVMLGLNLIIKDSE